MTDHPSHTTRFSDSSLYDEKCIHCGATDSFGDTRLQLPCPDAPRAPVPAPFTMQRISYTVDHSGNIALDTTKAPFDGKAVLIKTRLGITEAWWDEGRTFVDHDGVPDAEGFEWCCLDDTINVSLDDASHWCPLPATASEDTCPLVVYPDGTDVNDRPARATDAVIEAACQRTLDLEFLGE